MCSVNITARSVKYEVFSVQCELFSVKYEVFSSFSVQYTVWIKMHHVLAQYKFDGIF